MSPIIARNIAARVAGRRQFSIISSLRNMGRAMESHPFERLPTTAKAAPADWGKEIKTIATRVSLFVPAMGFVLGWPYLAKVVCDGHI